MKKFFVFLLSMIPVVASGANYLDIKIQDLTRIKQERIAELEKCQDVTGGLKIAGLTTLGISTIGIAANITEAVVLKQKKDDVTELDKEIEKLNAEIRVYNKLQEGKKVNKGNDIRCGGDVNITNNTYNVTRYGDTYQIQKDGDVYNIDVNADVDGSIDIEKLLKGEKDFIDELIRGGKAVRKFENGEDSISVKSNNGQGFHITVENNSGSQEYLVAVQDKKVKFGANVTLSCDFVTVSPVDSKVKIKYRVKDSGDDFSETAPTVTGKNENKRIEYSVWVNDENVAEGEFDCAFYKDDVVAVEEESEEGDIVSVKVNKNKLTEHTVGNVKITCETVEITPDDANVEVWYSLTESAPYTTDMPEITSGTPVNVYYKVVNKTTKAVVTDKDGAELKGTIACSKAVENVVQVEEIVEETVTSGPEIIVERRDLTQDYKPSGLLCDGVKVKIKEGGVERDCVDSDNINIKYSSNGENGIYVSDVPRIINVKDSRIIYFEVYQNDEFVVSNSFKCVIKPVENPIKLDPNQGTLNFKENKDKNKITFTVKDAQGRITVSSSNDNVASKYDNNKVTVTVQDSGKKENSVVTIAVTATTEPGSNYKSGVAYYSLKIIGTKKRQAVVEKDPNEDTFKSTVEQNLEAAEEKEVNVTFHEGAEPALSWCKTVNDQSAIKITELIKRKYPNPHIYLGCKFDERKGETDGTLYRYYNKPVACEEGYCLSIKSMDASYEIKIDTDVSGCMKIDQDNNENFLFNYMVTPNNTMVPCKKDNKDLKNLKACWNSSYTGIPLDLCVNWCKTQKSIRPGAYAAKCILDNAVILKDGTCNCNMEEDVTNIWASRYSLGIEL